MAGQRGREVRRGGVEEQEQPRADEGERARAVVGERARAVVGERARAVVGKPERGGAKEWARPEVARHGVRLEGMYEFVLLPRVDAATANRCCRREWMLLPRVLSSVASA